MALSLLWNLVLISYVAGDVCGDREVLEKAVVDLAEKDDRTDAEESDVL